MSLCKTCQYRLLPWSESLRDTWDGCGKGLEIMSENINPDSFVEGIDAETVGIGWITNGKMAFNDQILTQNTRKCEYYSQKKEN